MFMLFTVTRSDDQCEDLLDQHFGDDLQIPDEIVTFPDSAVTDIHFVHACSREAHS